MKKELSKGFFNPLMEIGFMDGEGIKILHKGTQCANTVAEETLAKVKSLTQQNYFAPRTLIG